ncbi:MAG: gamma-glutamyltransferase [Pseudomonadota bacterium]|nr:gamma-glutamyltransferase [Pseudomonadota bacterium]
MRNLEAPGRSPVHATGSMAATSHPLATSAAIDILRKNGNAMDAAIAACAVQCVVEPQSTGIGGDCFVLYSQNGSDNIIGYNGSGRAPAKATPEWFDEQGISEIEQHSPHAVTIPGAIDAWCRLHKDYGSKSLNEIFSYAIDYARNGYPVHDRVAFDWARCKNLLTQDLGASQQFLIDGNTPKPGSVHKQQKLANTLEKIATEGRNGFYSGVVAEEIVTHLKNLGGAHEIEDFSTATGEYVIPIKTNYRGYEVHECPPNGQGVIALLMLNILNGLELEKLELLSSERLHLFIEAGKLAYSARDAFVGDPNQVDVPINKLLSNEYASELRKLIDPRKAANGITPASIPHSDTVYLTVVDKDRNAVSFINSLFQSFGSGIVAPNSGVILHNRGYSFNLNRDHPNCIAPNKRPMHTIIPGMLTKSGSTVMPFGVMGGQYQSFGHAYFLTNIFEYGLDLQEAIDLPRLFPTIDGPVEIESGMPSNIFNELQGLGHKICRPEKPIGGAQAIWIDWEKGTLTGGSEPRKDGLALGY